jgi:hypothetical protein
MEDQTKKIQDSRTFGLSNWKNRVHTYWKKSNCKRNTFRRENTRISLKSCSDARPHSDAEWAVEYQGMKYRRLGVGLNILSCKSLTSRWYLKPWGQLISPGNESKWKNAENNQAYSRAPWAPCIPVYSCVKTAKDSICKMEIVILYLTALWGKAASSHTLAHSITSKFKPNPTILLKTIAILTNQKQKIVFRGD